MSLMSPAPGVVLDMRTAVSSVKLPRIATVAGLPCMDETTLGAFRVRGMEIRVFPSEGELLAQEDDPYDLAFLPDAQRTGWEGLRHLKDASFATHVIILASNPSVAGAVTAMKAGASDYLTPPVSARDLLTVIDQVLDRGREEDSASNPGPLPPFAVGASAEWKDVVARARRVASSLVTVLIKGRRELGRTCWRGSLCLWGRGTAILSWRSTARRFRRA